MTVSTKADGDFDAATFFGAWIANRIMIPNAKTPSLRRLFGRCTFVIFVWKLFRFRSRRSSLRLKLEIVKLGNGTELLKETRHWAFSGQSLWAS
ncbi:hypothetical protein Hanom_Chr14g01297421 [Helianthus anomalus]